MSARVVGGGCSVCACVCCVIVIGAPFGGTLGLSRTSDATTGSVVVAFGSCLR